MKLGDTFVWCPDRGKDHLWILISDPSKNDGTCVLVNLTESRHGKYSFILKPGDHEFIYKDSDVAFGDAIKTTEARLQIQVDLEQAKPNRPMKRELIKKIVDEAHRHGAFQPILRKIIPPAGSL